QRLLLTVADQVECTWRRGLAAGETKWTELESIEIGRKLRHRAFDPPLAPKTQATAPPAGATRIGQQPVTHERHRHVAFDHLHRDVRVVMHYERQRRCA